MGEPAPSPFSAILPTFQTSWDSTSLGWFKECPQLYKYQMIDRWSPRSKGVHLAFGGWYASGLEHYARARALGATHDAACISMVRTTLTASGTYTDTGTFLPWSPDATIGTAALKTRYTLIRALIWNVEERQTSPFSTYIRPNGHPAVELSFSFHAFTLDGESISLSGHLDEVVTADDQYWIRDDKTTGGALGQHYFRQFTPNNQMSLYSLAGKIILNLPIRGVLVKAAQIGVNFVRFQTAQVPRPVAVLDEWFEDTRAWITLAKRYAEQNHWPKNDKSCGNYGGCPFQSVCAVSPSHRLAWLEQDFIRREWNPLETRSPA